ncbi:MAG: hypothetical protein JW902_11815, partial [Syntrophaceae bacterium]|nr:hypothetical protein [Syntrophaceae bacterium]
VLKKWLKLIEENLDLDGLAIHARAAKIDSNLPKYLEHINFFGIWAKLQKNYPNRHNLLRQFHAWFDGLKTLKLIHYLTENGYPKISTNEAIEDLEKKIGPIAAKGNDLRVCTSMTETRSFLQAVEKGIRLNV